MLDLRRVCVSALLVFAACSDDEVSSDGDDGGSSTGAASTGGPTSSVDDTNTTTAAVDSSGGGDATTTGGEELDTPPYAGDIRLVRVTANQAVQVELYADDAEIPEDEYNTRLISGRRTLLRGFWSLHADFQPRPLIGRLTVDYPDGTQIVQDYEVMVDGDSGDGGASFQWLLEPDQVVDGMLYRAKILEVSAETASGTIADPPPIAPLAGRGSLGIYDTPLELKVWLVPVLHQFDGCEQAPEPTAEDVDDMRKELEQNNAVQVATFEVVEPMPYTDPIGTSGTGFGPVLSALAMRREMDAPPDNVYYYGLLDPCDGYPPGLLGQAIGIPPETTPELAHQRISTGRWNGSGAAAAETFVHEVGHTQGRRHVLCSGGEAGTDANYPHLNGRIGVWGFGIYDFQLRTPAGGRDYMTYCSNEWVSDYGWEQTLDVIEILTSWDAGGAPAGERPLALFGALYPDGTADWWTGHGGVPASGLGRGDRVRFTTPAGDTELDAWMYTRPDGDTTQVVVPLPANFAAVTDLTMLPADGPQRTVARTAIRELHAR